MIYQYLQPSYYRERTPTNHWWGKLLYWALGPVGFIGTISFLLLIINFYFTFRVRPYTSDDVILQNALLYWRPFHHMTYFSDAGASYVDRLPLYWLVGQIFSPGRHALFVDGLLIAIGNFVLVYWSAIYLLKKTGIRLTYVTLLPFLWLNSFGFVVNELFVEASMHNIEVGIILALCVLVVKLYSGEFQPLASWKSRFVTLAGALAFGYTIVGDRYLIYYGLLPILLFAAGGFLYTQRQALRKRIGLLFGFIVLSLIFAGLIQMLFAKAGVDFQSGVGARPPQFVSYPSFFTNVWGTIYNLFVVFEADFWNRNVLSITAIGAVVNGVLLFLILRVAIQRLRSITTEQFTTDTTMPLQLIVVLFLWSIFILTISSIGGVGTYHYFVLLPFAGTLLLVSYLATVRGTNLRLMPALLLVAILFNFGINFHNAVVPASISSNVYSGRDQANRRDTDIAQALEAHGLTGSKGYANYWQANITSYLSGGKLDILPALCTDGGQTVVYKWLMTSYQRTHQTAKTFFLFDTTYIDAPNCTSTNVRTQYGTPAQIFDASGTTVYVYNRNITAPIQ